MISGLNLLDKFEKITEYWSPKIIAEVNNQYVKIAKVKGQFVWHNHEKEDELFYVLKGQLCIDLPTEQVTISEGEMFIVKKGIQHKPFAEQETWILLYEPKNTKHTGEVNSNLTVDKQNWI